MTRWRKTVILEMSKEVTTLVQQVSHWYIRLYLTLSQNKHAITRCHNFTTKCHDINDVCFFVDQEFLILGYISGIYFVMCTFTRRRFGMQIFLWYNQDQRSVWFERIVQGSWLTGFSSPDIVFPPFYRPKFTILPNKRLNDHIIDN